MKKKGALERRRREGMKDRDGGSFPLEGRERLGSTDIFAIHKQTEPRSNHN